MEVDYKGEAVTARALMDTHSKALTTGCAESKGVGPALLRRPFFDRAKRRAASTSATARPGLKRDQILPSTTSTMMINRTRPNPPLGP